MRPYDPVTLREAAATLGCAVSTVQKHIDAGRLKRRRGRYKHSALSRAEVEQLACEVWDWRRHLHDPSSYWVTTGDAAALLGVSTARVKQLAAADRLPFERHRDGTMLFRRAQLVVMSRR